MCFCSLVLSQKGDVRGRKTEKDTAKFGMDLKHCDLQVSSCDAPAVQDHVEWQLVEGLKTRGRVLLIESAAGKLLRHQCSPAKMLLDSAPDFTTVSTPRAAAAQVNCQRRLAAQTAVLVRQLHEHI